MSEVGPTDCSNNKENRHVQGSKNRRKKPSEIILGDKEVLREKYVNSLPLGIITKNTFWTKDDHDDYHNMEVIEAVKKKQETPKMFEFQEQDKEPIQVDAPIIQPAVFKFQEDASEDEQRHIESETQQKQQQIPASKSITINDQKAFGNSTILPGNMIIKPLEVFDFGQEEEEQQDLDFYNLASETTQILTDVPVGLNIEDFISRATPKGYVLQCCVRRDMLDSSSPIYSIYMGGSFKHLLSFKKKPFCATSNYIISTCRKNIKSETPYYVGKTRSNFLGTVFKGYSRGQNPTKSQDWNSVRSCLVTIQYDTNFFGNNGPRKMIVHVPKPLENNNTDYIKPTDPDKGLENELYAGSVLKFINRPPEWDKQLKAYVLNFNGRVTKASVKNFLLIDPETEKVKMLFGRVAKNVFNLDIEYPFSVLQAASVIVSSFDSKLACQ